MLTPEELIDAYQGRAGLLAKAILFGITEPVGDASLPILSTLSQALVDELISYHKTEFLKRFPRALVWAVREDIPPEIAIVTIEQVLQLQAHRKIWRAKVAKMPEYKAYLAKLGSIEGVSPI